MRPKIHPNHAASCQYFGIRMVLKIAPLGRQGRARPIKSVVNYSIASAQYQCSVSNKRPHLIIVMHFLRPLVFSAIVFASAAFAATIHVDGCGETTAKEIEIDIIVHYKQPAEVSQQSVFLVLNSPLNTHIHVIVCYTFSNLHTSLTNLDCVGTACVHSSECQEAGCKWCRASDYTVSLARVLEQITF